MFPKSSLNFPKRNRISWWRESRRFGGWFRFAIFPTVSPQGNLGKVISLFEGLSGLPVGVVASFETGPILEQYLLTFLGPKWCLGLGAKLWEVKVWGLFDPKLVKQPCWTYIGIAIRRRLGPGSEGIQVRQTSEQLEKHKMSRKTTPWKFYSYHPFTIYDFKSLPVFFGCHAQSPGIVAAGSEMIGRGWDWKNPPWLPGTHTTVTSTSATTTSWTVTKTITTTTDTTTTVSTTQARSRRAGHLTDIKSHEHFNPHKIIWWYSPK